MRIRKTISFKEQQTTQDLEHNFI